MHLDLETSSSPKIDSLTAISFLKFKGTWKLHFLSHALHIFKMIITFEGVLFVLLEFFVISHGLEDRKISTKCTIHSCSLSLLNLIALIFSFCYFYNSKILDIWSIDENWFQILKFIFRDSYIIDRLPMNCNCAYTISQDFLWPLNKIAKVH